jgi:hypothetical protein
VVTDRIADNAVTTLKINDAAVTTSKINDAAVTSSKLSTTGVTAGTYGSSTRVPRVTVDTKGRVTSADSVSIDFGAVNWSLQGNTMADSTSNWLGTVNMRPLVVKTNGLERMRITSDGKMGVGVNSPSKKFHVAGSTDSSDVRFDALAYSSHETAPTGAYGVLIADSMGNIHRQSPESTLVGSTWLLSGNLLSASGNRFIGSKNHYPVVFKTNSVERVRITENGDVGIGTTSPQATFHVDGSIRIGDNGTNLTKIIKVGIAVDPGTISAGSYLDLDLDVANATTGSVVYVSPSANLESGLIIAFSRVSAPGVVRVRLQNVSASNINPSPTTFETIVVE